MPETSEAAKQKCSYHRGEWPCPFVAEAGQKLCIFHLPVNKKKPEDFWGHMASYLQALYGHELDCGRTDEVGRFLRKLKLSHWVKSQGEEQLVETYRGAAARGRPWRFTGFEFPSMDREHEFLGFAFDEADFAEARFSGDANFRDSIFGNKSSYFGARFSGKSDFSNTKFGGDAIFATATFEGEANFSAVAFGGEANFNAVIFGREAHYWQANFDSEAYFHFAVFRGPAKFGGTTFSGPVYLSMATVKAVLDITGARLRNRLLFEGTSFGDNARVLLWDVDFVLGTSDVTMEEGFQKGQIIEPAGQIVFRDISANMNRVSFLHTDILTDRLLIRFSDVKWETDPKQFIFDARFAFCQDAARWREATGLLEAEIASLPALFHAIRLGPLEETPEQRQQRAAQMQAECVPLVRRDVERIAREIRRSTELYGSYSDAGDFHIAEMEYRRVQAPRFSFRRFLLTGYKCFSLYGESAGRAFAWFAGVWFVSALLYVFAGFTFGKTDAVRYALAFDKQFAWPALWRLCADFLHALAFSFVSLIPGYFRFTAPAEWPTPFTPFLVVTEAVFGIGLLTLFLLAIRRRFRR